MSGDKKVNRKGNTAKKVLVTSGHEKDRYHYYCGHKRDTRCLSGGCNDICGPSNGCNCTACAELDRFEGLMPAGAPLPASSSSASSTVQLVNRNGNTVKYVHVTSGHEEGKYHHYCGKKRDTVCPTGKCNDICGPGNGCNCSACRELDHRVLPYTVVSSPTMPPPQYQAPQQYQAPPQYQAAPPPQYQQQYQAPPQQYQAAPQQYQVPPQQYQQVPQQYYPPVQSLYSPPPPYAPQQLPQQQPQPQPAYVNNNNYTCPATAPPVVTTSSPTTTTTTKTITTATSSPTTSSPSAKETATAVAGTAAAVLSTGFKLLKPVVKATASAATSLVKTAAHHIVDNDKDNMCVICMEKPKNASLIHGQSAHQCCCVECGELLKKTGQLCPICRAPITMVVRNYQS